MDKKKTINLLNEIKEKSFPVLKGKRFYLYNFVMSKKYYGGAWWIFPFWRAIFINPKKKFTKEQLISIFAHELCHFELFQKRGWLAYLFIGIRYWTSPKFRKKEERDTEKLLIRKGYARETYNLVKKRELNKTISKYYFSPEEIKSYAQKIGKW